MSPRNIITPAATPSLATRNIHMPEGAARLLRSICLRLLTVAAVVLVAGLASATMVRFAPGFGVDERELDSRLNSESMAALRAQNSTETNIAHFYWRFVTGLL